MQRTAFLCATVVIAAACHRGSRGYSDDTAPRPLAAFAVQRLIVAPTAHVRASDSLGWTTRLNGVRGVARRLDSSIVAALDARGLASRWVMPADLLRSYERNRTYAADPALLAVEEVRAPAFKAGNRFGEPLSSQLRTMIALYEDVRYVLLPVDVRFERQPGVAGGRAVLRLVLLDPRFAESKWVGDVQSEPVPSPDAALAGVAERLADLFAAP